MLDKPFELAVNKILNQQKFEMNETEWNEVKSLIPD